MLAAIRSRELDQKISRFLSNQPEATAADLPGWSAFRALLGDSAELREYFVQLLRDYPVELSAFSRDRRLRESCIGTLIDSVLAVDFTDAADWEFDVVDQAVVCLLLACEVQDDSWSFWVPNSLRIRIDQLLGRPDFVERLSGGIKERCLRHLVASWVDRQSLTDVSLGSALTIAEIWDIGESLGTVSRKVLGSGVQAGSIRSRAAIHLLIARDPSLERLVQPLLNDSTIVYAENRDESKAYQVKVSDVVLAVLILSSGEQPADYGFVEPDFDQDLSADSYRQMGFDDPASRQTAIAKWNQRHRR